MKIRTNLKAGGRKFNHNETLVREGRKPNGVKVRTNLKAGGRLRNHNQILVRDTR
jgi:hypothetical protein